MSFMVFKHGLIGECARVAIEAKVRRNSTPARQHHGSDYTEPAGTHYFSPTPKHHITREPRRRRFFLLRTHPADETFDIAFPADRQLEPAKSAGEHGAALCQDSRLRNHNPDARRPPALGQFRPPLRVSTNPVQSA